MTSQKKYPNVPENSDNKYKLNMEILNSLKPIPGKIISLQSENFINDELNKKLQYPEGKKTTSSSISKVSKEFFCDPLEDKLTNKKLITTNSVFKPMSNMPKKKSTMNYFPFNTSMSFPDLCIQNPIGNAPPKITNSSFSRNSFCLMNPNLEPNPYLLNPLNFTGNQMNNNTFTQINQINQYNIFCPNPFNSFNTLNVPQNPLNDIFLTKNNNNNSNNINNINNSNEKNNNNIFLGEKRNSSDKIEEKEKPDNNINNINNNKKNIFFKTNSQKKGDLNLNNLNNNIIDNNNNIINDFINTNSLETTSKRIMFTVIQKSVYNYKKRKPRKRKILNRIKNKIKCSHKGCEGIFKTKKQLVYHHYKMNPQCQNDTITILKMIYDIKKILIKNNFEKNKIKFGELYKTTMKKISLDEHIETLVGYNFEDEINENVE